MRGRYLTVLTLVLMSGSVVLSPQIAAAASKTVKCGSATIKGGQRITSITAKGVTCTYVKKTFVTELGNGPPKGWTATRRSLGHGNNLLTWRNGKKTITYHAYVPA